MSRKLFIVDRPPGPNGGARYEFRMFASASTAKRNAEPQGAGYSGRATPRDRGTVLVVDLDELTPLDATPAEQYERAERMLLHWTAEEARLRPALRDGEAPSDSYQKRVDAVLDAARNWRRSYEKRCKQTRNYKPTRREVLLFHALCVLDDGGGAILNNDGLGRCPCGMSESPQGCEEWCDGGK